MAENEKNKAEELEEQEEITVSDLNKEIEKLKKENEKYYEHLQRTAAEFDNYKKRVMKEKEKIYSLAVGDVVTKYIAVLDNLDKAVVAETTDPKAKEGKIDILYYLIFIYVRDILFIFCLGFM